MNIRPIRTAEELEKVHEAAVADGHHLVWPSHMVERDGFIVGSLSVLPTVLTWMDTKRTKVRDSLQIKMFYEGLVANTSRVVCVPCLETSPYFQYLPKDNYIDLGKINLFVKGI